MSEIMSQSVSIGGTTSTSGLPKPPPSLQVGSNDSPPPSYTENESNIADITAAFSKLNLAASRTPTAHQCIAHLKLLEVFHQLREDVALKDGLFGIYDIYASKEGTKREHAELLTKIREKRWAIYVARAVIRFQRWWTVCVEPTAKMLKQQEIQSTSKQAIYNGPGIMFDHNNLPPLDVIMVWHTYQLNPRDFLEDCLRYGKLKFWRTGLPWAAVNACIDNDSFVFMATIQAISSFECSTGLSWNNIYDPELSISCPLCSKAHIVPWTEWNTPNAWSSTQGGIGPLNGEAKASGFADQNFTVTASCGITLDHDLLRTQKFRKDIEALRLDDVPLPGTILTLDGLPEAPRDIQRHEPLFPNRLILGPNAESSPIYKSLESLTAPAISNNSSMTTVRLVISETLRDSSYVKRSNHTFTKVLSRREKISIRKMMSRYWDNSSPFALDLVGAVIRQGSFIEKMHAIDWIHSPALHSTMSRILIKYNRYISIIASNPGHVAVPTLDVDLVWHTHQLSPPTYFAHTVGQTKKFLGHDDKIDETKLSTAFAWTSKTYQNMFKELYSECTCWYCEAIRESHTSNLRRVFSKDSMIDNQLSNLHPTSSNPHSTPHISAHNAIKPDTGDAHSRSMRETVLRLKLERDYKKSCDRARKQRREPPTRDEYMYAYTYGYMMYMPYYAPYMGDPGITGGMYASNPACATFAPGAAGNCCDGACGGGVAAGACAGSGGCQGGGAGGCGGGDGGGGGCGGGCGGG